MSEPGWLLQFVMDVNHFRTKAHIFKGMKGCPNFSQMSQTPGMLTIRVCLPQVFNRVIHSFRGYPESMCQLNWLTKL